MHFQLDTAIFQEE